MRYEMKVTTQREPLNIRTAAGIGNKVVGSLPVGSTVIVNGVSNVGGINWYKLEDGRGWSSGQYLQVTKDLEQATPAVPIPDDKTFTIIITDGTEAKSDGLDTNIINMLYNSTKRSRNYLDASTRLFGAPFQFLKSVDYRLSESADLGRKYIENIISESPIVKIVPGRPDYLPDFSESEKKAFIAATTNISDDKTKKMIEDITNGKDNVRYFGFLTDYTQYMRYVNLLCRICAVYIGLGSDSNIMPGTKTPYRFYDWDNYKYYNTYANKATSGNSVFDFVNAGANEKWRIINESLTGEYKYSQFYIEPPSFSESAGNSTSSSQLEGVVQGGQNLMKELAFVTNSAGLELMNTENLSGFDNYVNGLLSKFGASDNIFSKILKSSTKVIGGSNIIFPELWQNSDYNKSYNMTVHLVSPYGDTESIYLNIIVPLMHILALALPRQTNANSFSSPFLVKATARSWFSCEMGIIDSISIDKGGEGGWNVDGLPLEMKVNISIKDLYNNLMISSSTDIQNFFQNQGLIEFLAVTCGLDVTRPNLLLKIDTLISVVKGSLVDLPGNISDDVIQAIRNQIEPLIKIGR